MGSAFTTYNDSISRTLTNDATLHFQDRSMQVKALWDTGATNSCISEDVVKSLGLQATGKIGIKTPSGDDVRNTYLVNVELPNNVTVTDLVVSDSAIGAQGIGMLVGMDIITLGDLAVSNCNGKTIFTFRIPSEKKTDYVNEIRIAKAIGPTHGKGKTKKRK